MSRRLRIKDWLSSRLRHRSAQVPEVPLAPAVPAECLAPVPSPAPLQSAPPTWPEEGSVDALDLSEEAEWDDEPELPPPRERSISEEFFLPDGTAPNPGEPAYADLDSLAAAAVPVDPRRQRIARTVVVSIMGSMALLLVVSLSVAAIRERERTNKESAELGMAPMLASNLALTVGRGATSTLAAARAAQEPPEPKVDDQPNDRLAAATEDSATAEPNEPAKAKPAPRRVGTKNSWRKRSKPRAKTKAKRKTKLGQKKTAKRKAKRKTKARRSKKSRRRAVAKRKRHSRRRL